MASDRIGKKSARLANMPPHIWTIEKANFVLEKEVVQKGLKKVPLNEPLVQNLLKEDLKNPFLCLPNWWPIAGSQRFKAIQHIQKEYNKDYNPEVYICKIEKDYHNFWYLLGDEEFRDKAIGLTFQLWELIFKSLWYKHDTTDDGTPMTYYEDLGEELKWEHDKNE